LPGDGTGEGSGEAVGVRPWPLEKRPVGDEEEDAGADKAETAEVFLFAPPTPALVGFGELL